MIGARHSLSTVRLTIPKHSPRGVRSINGARPRRRGACYSSNEAVRVTPALPSFASASARSFHFAPLCPLTCLSQSFPLSASYVCFHSSLAAAASALFLRARQTDVVIIAAYFESYRSRAGAPSPCSRACRTEG